MDFLEITSLFLKSERKIIIETLFNFLLHHSLINTEIEVKKRL